MNYDKENSVSEQATKKAAQETQQNDKESSNVEKFEEIASGLAKLYAQKNNAYGDSFGASVKKYGMVSALTRISDKFNRFENLVLHPGIDAGDERMIDTLEDLASYAIMTIMAYRELKAGEIAAFFDRLEQFDLDDKNQTTISDLSVAIFLYIIIANLYF